MTREPKGTGMIGGMININFWYLQIKEDKVNINELNDILNKNAQEFDKYLFIQKLFVCKNFY